MWLRNDVKTNLKKSSNTSRIGLWTWINLSNSLLWALDKQMKSRNFLHLRVSLPLFHFFYYSPDKNRVLCLYISTCLSLFGFFLRRCRTLSSREATTSRIGRVKEILRNWNSNETRVMIVQVAPEFFGAWLKSFNQTVSRRGDQARIGWEEKIN